MKKYFNGLSQFVEFGDSKKGSESIIHSRFSSKFTPKMHLRFGLLWIMLITLIIPFILREVKADEVKDAAIYLLSPAQKSAEEALERMKKMALERVTGSSSDNSSSVSGSAPRTIQLTQSSGEGKRDTFKEGADIILRIWGIDDFFDFDLDSKLQNQDYKDLLAIDSTLETVEDDFTRLATDTMSKRLEIKTALINSLSDLGWRLKIPLYPIDSKIVLLKSYLKTLLAYYKQLKKKKIQFDEVTKKRTKALIKILNLRFRDISTPQTRTAYINKALTSSVEFKRMIAQYHAQNSVFKKKVSFVVQYIREIDLAITKLKEKRLDLEMGIVAGQMTDRLDTILKDVRSFNTSDVVKQIDEQWTGDILESSGDVHITQEAVVDFLYNLGIKVMTQ